MCCLYLSLYESVSQVCLKNSHETILPCLKINLRLIDYDLFRTNC